jgi:hypothetical protein
MRKIATLQSCWARRANTAGGSVLYASGHYILSRCRGTEVLQHQ